MYIEVFVNSRTQGEFYEEAWLAKANILGLDGPAIWLNSKKQNLLKGLDDRHAKILRSLTGNATIEERDTWQLKAQAARAFLEGNAADYQMALIVAEAGDDEQAQQVLAQTIVARSAAFHTLIGVAARIRTTTKAAINAANSNDELDQVLAAAEVQAAQAIEQLQVALAQGAG